LTSNGSEAESVVGVFGDVGRAGFDFGDAVFVLVVVGVALAVGSQIGGGGVVDLAGHFKSLNWLVIWRMRRRCRKVVEIAM